MKLSELNPKDVKVEPMRLSQMAPGSYEIEAVETPKQYSAGERAGAALQGFGQGALMGYLPQAQGLVSALTPDPNADLNRELRAKGFKIEEPKGGYLAARDAAIAEQTRLAEEMPGSYYGGQVGGAIATAPMIAGKLAKIPGLAAAGKGAGLLTKVGKAGAAGAIQGAVQNPGDTAGVIDPVQSSERASGAFTGGLIGAGTQGAAEALKSGAKALGAAPKKLMEYGQEKAFKQSGAMLKDFRKAFQKNRVHELGQEMIDSKLVRPGMSVEDIAEKSGALKQEVGAKIGAVYDKIKGSISIAVDPNKMTGELVDAVSAARPKLGAQAYDDKMMEVIGDISSDPAKLSDIRHLNDMIGEIDDRINFSKRANELPIVQQGYMAVRRKLRDQVNQVVEAAGKLSDDPEMGKNLKALNRRYGNLAEISSISKDKAARNSANRMMSPSDYGVGAVGGTVGAITGGIQGAALGLAGAGVNKLARTYGPGLLANAAVGGSKLASKVAGPGLMAAEKAGGIAASAPVMTGATSAGLLNRRKNK